VDPTMLCPFGCPAYAHVLGTLFLNVPKEQCGRKFCPHGWKCIMIGYTYGQQAYKLLDI
ncbi:hypothetical protein PAXRUDRAFT_147082, partial [Paxillus rubicundulus Ve08.2h10]